MEQAKRFRPSTDVVRGAARWLTLHRYGSFAEGIVNLANLAYFVALALVAAAVARFSFDWRQVAG